MLANRHGVIINASGADELFTNLNESVTALARLAEPPLTTAIAVTTLKRYLPDPVRRIDLYDLVTDAAVRVVDEIGHQPVEMSLTNDDVEMLWNTHLAAVNPLACLLITGIWHDPDGVHDQLWLDTLQRLVDVGTAPLSQWTSGLDTARLWPALVAMTAAGVACVQRGRDDLLIALATRVTGRLRSGGNGSVPAGQLLHTERVLGRQWVNAMPRWGGNQGWRYPASHLLKGDIRILFDELIPDEENFVDAFHGYEYRLGLIQERQQDNPLSYRALCGEYIGERGWTYSQPSVPIAEQKFVEQQEQLVNSP